MKLKMILKFLKFLGYSKIVNDSSRSEPRVTLAIFAPTDIMNFCEYDNVLKRHIKKIINTFFIFFFYKNNKKRFYER